MKGFRGVLSGVLALIALQAVVGSDQAAKRAGGACRCSPGWPSGCSTRPYLRSLTGAARRAGR